VVKLINGTEVDESSQEWEDECITRKLHVYNFTRLQTKYERDRYLYDVKAHEGQDALDRLKWAINQDFERRVKEAHSESRIVLS